MSLASAWQTGKCCVRQTFETCDFTIYFKGDKPCRGAVPRGRDYVPSARHGESHHGTAPKICRFRAV